MTTGARAQRASVLEKLEELMKAEAKLEEKQIVLQEAKKELAVLKKKADEYVMYMKMLLSMANVLSAV